MPDLPISLLPATVTPELTDELASEQSAVTKKLTLQQIKDTVGGSGDLQDAYDSGNEINLVKDVPVKLISTASSSSSAFEIEDQLTGKNAFRVTPQSEAIESDYDLIIPETQVGVFPNHVTTNELGAQFRGTTRYRTLVSFRPGTNTTVGINNPTEVLINGYVPAWSFTNAGERSIAPPSLLLTATNFTK